MSCEDGELTSGFSRTCQVSSQSSWKPLERVVRNAIMRLADNPHISLLEVIQLSDRKLERMFNRYCLILSIKIVWLKLKIKCFSKRYKIGQKWTKKDRDI
tara:strand:+ start:7059 stop:7358 length:300 start_codon:yes stop_codon:yes gene_type:complete